MKETFSRYRRNLPHFRLDGATYHIIWRVHSSIEQLPEFTKQATLQTILRFYPARYELQGCVVMDDHVHVVITPVPEWPLVKIVHTWKSYTAHATNKRLNRTGPIWLDEYYDRIIRDEDDLYEKLKYIYNNPRERWPEERNYPYLWIKGLTDRTGESPVPPT